MGTNNRTARIAGWLYLGMMPFAAFGFFYVPSALVVPGDAAATSRNIMASELLFRGGTVGWLISHIFLIFLVLVLYRLFEHVNKDHAALMVVLALLSVPIVFLSEINHLAALQVLESAKDRIDAQHHAQVMLYLDMRQSGILVAQVFYGLWLLPLGILVFKSGFVPRLLGILLMVAAAGYVIDWGTQLLVPGFPAISLFTFVGELLFPLWLVIKGVNVERRLQPAPA